MSVPYSVVAKGNPANPSAPKKYYMQVKSSSEITLRQLSEQIGAISTVSSIDTLAVLEALLQILPKEIADGKIVRLGDFGSFSLSLKSEGAENEEDVSSRNLKSSHLRFRPGKEIKKVLANIEYKKV